MSACGVKGDAAGGRLYMGSRFYAPTATGLQVEDVAEYRPEDEDDGYGEGEVAVVEGAIEAWMGGAEEGGDELERDEGDGEDEEGVVVEGGGYVEVQEVVERTLAAAPGA